MDNTELGYEYYNLLEEEFVEKKEEEPVEKEEPVEEEEENFRINYHQLRKELFVYGGGYRFQKGV
jgi:hypothetical protein